MAPSTTSQHLNQSSPPQETTHPPKRSLRNRGSNTTITTNSSQHNTMGGDSEVIVAEKSEFDGDGDARGKFPSPPQVSLALCFPGKIKVAAPGDQPASLVRDPSSDVFDGIC